MLLRRPQGRRNWVRLCTSGVGRRQGSKEGQRQRVASQPPRTVTTAEIGFVWYRGSQSCQGAVRASMGSRFVGTARTPYGVTTNPPVEGPPRQTNPIPGERSGAGGVRCGWADSSRVPAGVRACNRGLRGSKTCLQSPPDRGLLSIFSLPQSAPYITVRRVINGVRVCLGVSRCYCEPGPNPGRFSVIGSV